MQEKFPFYGRLAEFLFQQKRKDDFCLLLNRPLFFAQLLWHTEHSFYPENTKHIEKRSQIIM